MLVLYILWFTGKSRISSNPLPSTHVLFCNSATLGTFCLQWRLLLTKPSEKVQVSLIYIFPSMFYVSYVLRISICLRAEIYTPSQTKKRNQKPFIQERSEGLWRGGKSHEPCEISPTKGLLEQLIFLTMKNSLGGQAWRAGESRKTFGGGSCESCFSCVFRDPVPRSTEGKVMLKL